MFIDANVRKMMCTKSTHLLLHFGLDRRKTVLLWCTWACFLSLQGWQRGFFSYANAVTAVQRNMFLFLWACVKLSMVWPYNVKRCNFRGLCCCRNRMFCCVVAGLMGTKVPVNPQANLASLLVWIHWLLPHVWFYFEVKKGKCLIVSASHTSFVLQSAAWLQRRQEKCFE